MSSKQAPLGNIHLAIMKTKCLEQKNSFWQIISKEQDMKHNLYCIFSFLPFNPVKIITKHSLLYVCNYLGSTIFYHC